MGCIVHGVAKSQTRLSLHFALLVGMQIDIATMENGMEIILKTRNKTTI